MTPIGKKNITSLLGRTINHLILIFYIKLINFEQIYIFNSMIEIQNSPNFVILILRLLIVHEFSMHLNIVSRLSGHCLMAMALFLYI